ncbi:MAG: AraC family transcriptional regulator [Oscillospiraceae bacterium]|nr:AraC family transcriptional regulator [Oscillospiraceae bacterium]
MFKIIRGGCHTRHNQGFVMSRENGFPKYVILIVHSGGEFVIDGVSQNVPPHSAVIIAPNTPYRYQLTNGNYMDDWIHFETDNPELLPVCNRLFPIQNADMYTSLVRRLLWEQSYTEDSGLCQENTDAIFTVLLNHFKYDYSHQSESAAHVPYEEELRQLKLDMTSHVNGDYSIASCAEKLHISISYFQALYKRLFGISFQRDLINMRIDYAKTLLETSDLSVTDIAETCGYQTDVHFFRQFKEIAGTTPLRYRRKEG